MSRRKRSMRRSTMRNDRGLVKFNRRVRLRQLNWDDEAKVMIAAGKGFRVVEKGVTDTDQTKRMYSIHSPAFGTDWSDQRPFEDRYSCKCGEYIGKNFKGIECEKCKTKVEFIDIDMNYTGWIMLDNHKVIQPMFYRKIAAFIGTKTFPKIITFVEPKDRIPTKANPYVGIGLLEFYERFNEIMDFFLDKKKHHYKQYLNIMANYDKVFVSSIPVFSTYLRMLVIKDGKMNYSKEDVLYNKMYTNSVLLNDRFELVRRRNNAVARKKDLFYLRTENILGNFQKDLNELWDIVFDTVKRKKGQIKEQILGGRLNYTGRNVIIPDVDLRADEVKLGYITFLEIYKLEIISLLVEMNGMTYSKAWNMWERATIIYSKEIYEIMCYMIKVQKVVIVIDRNPTINYGSQIAVRVVGIIPDMNNHTLSLPISILVDMNADFDGDILNMESIKPGYMSDEYYEALNPRSNCAISKNDGKYNIDTGLFKDQIIGVYSFLNID